MLALTWDNAEGAADLSYESGSLAEGDALTTAVLLSLFLDAPARESDPLPKGTPRGGYWGDAYETEHPGDVTGSRLWVLRRWPLSDAAIPVAVEAIEDALAWMVEDGIASKVRGIAEIRAGGFLAIAAEITRPADPAPKLVGYWNAITGAAA